MNIERKWLDIPFESKGINEDNEYYTFKGYASTFGNRDLGGDVVVKGAFRKSLSKRKPKLVYQHDVKQPLGIFTTVYEDDLGLYVEGKMPKDNSKVRDIVSLMKLGAIDSMSIGYNVVDGEMDDDKFLLKDLDLWEVSLVTIPMNESAKITEVKGAMPFKDLPLADREMAWDSTAAVKRIREFTNSNDMPSDRYKNAFLWFDSESPENFGSYKLPYADVVDGSLKAVPRGIFAVAGVLQGARGGVDIPQADIDKIKGVVEKYYEKMEMKAPWLKSFQEIQDEIKTIKDLSNFLKSKGLSKNETEMAILKVKNFTKQGNPDNEGNLQKEIENLLINTKQLVKTIKED